MGTIKARMGASHFLTKALPKVAAEMALHVFAYNLTWVVSIMATARTLEALGIELMEEAAELEKERPLTPPDSDSPKSTEQN